MLVGLNELLITARSEQKAIAAFNTPTLEMVRGAIAAAEELNVPVILQHAEGHDTLIPLTEIGPIIIDYAKRSKVPVSVHLDHGKTLEAVMTAIKLGFTSVMIDASDLPFEENIATTKEIVKIAHAAGVAVEAELGHVFTSSLGGGEGRAPDDDQVGSNASIYTDPQQALEFVRRTQVDCLAVAFGTVHGVYLKDPQLDLPRVKEIFEEVKIPLVMHGGSGVKEAEYRQAIQNGITKINYYTYANQAGARGVAKFLHREDAKDIFFEDIAKAATEEIKADYLAALSVFSS